MRAKVLFLLILSLITLFVFSFFQSAYIGYGLGEFSSYYPSGYNQLGSTGYISGSLSDLQSDNNVYMIYRGYPSAFSTTTRTRAFIGYRSNSGTNLLSSPKGRGWSGTAWDTGETELPTAGSPVRYVRVAYSTLPQFYDYKVIATLSDDGTLDAYVYNGTSWIVTNDIADLWTTAPTGAQRPYDITFETSSGNALLVYGWFDDATYDLAYRIWFASNQSWSGQRLLDDPTEATEVDYSFVILDNDKTSGSNYIGLIAQVTTSSDSLTAIWNGSNWADIRDLSTNVSIVSEEDIGIAWAYDGSLMAVSGEGANEVIRWNRWTKTSGWGTSSTFDMDAAQTLITNWITLKADPASDDLMLTMVDSGSDLHSGYWNGATWSITSNIDTAVDTNAQRPVDFDWEPTGSKGLLVRGTTAGSITWRRWTTGTGWSADSNTPMGANAHAWVQLRRNPRNVAGDILILGAVLEITANDLGAISWDGTSFTVIGSSTFSVDTATRNYESFEIRFQNFGDPTEIISEVEFTGTSDTQNWAKLVWTVDSAWTTTSVTTAIQLYNYTLGQYPTSGDGYTSYISNGTPNTDETRNQTITTNPVDFRDSLGNWKLKIKGVKATSTRFDFKADLVQFETSVADITPPVWSDVGTNDTLAGQPTLFQVKWTDSGGMSGFIFGTNNTGIWVNDTWTPISGQVGWSNVTKILNNTGGVIVQWRVWANDTSNNWNDTGILSLITTQLPVASFTYSPTTPYTSETVTFNASASYDPDGSIVSYSWNFGDGANATGVVTSHAYDENGIYTVALTVTDDDGLTDTDIKSIAVLNRPPVASFTESTTTAPTGTPIFFNASASYDLDGSIVSYSWTFGDGTDATGVTVSHAYADNGIYTVTLTVTDNDSASATATATKTITNRPPTASFTESATTVYTGEVIVFNASASYDPDGTITSYFWTFGDGTNATGVTVSHAYSENGTYTVTLTVTDDDGATATASATKTVLNQPPVASFTESATTVYKNEIIYFNASASYDPDDWIVSYFWDFGDGANATGVAVDHAYTNVGTYTVTLTITDNDGSTASMTAVKNVLSRPPVASFTESATTVYTGEVIYFNASASYDPDGSVVSYFWTFGDGANATGVDVSHAYSNNGLYTVALTVTDSDGATDTATATKTVLNRAPTASFTESATTVLTGEVIYFNASASYDLDGVIVSYFWDFGDGTNASGVTVSHAYTNNGIYTVTLIVTDDDGATASTTATKTVLNRAPVASFTESATTVYRGEVIRFNASASYDPDGSIVSYFWNFGDGTNATGIVVDHAYTDIGTYTVTLTITDDDGSTGTATAIKTVLNRPPVASFTESATTVFTGEVIYFNASGSYDSDGTIVSYFWAFGDGTNATGVVVSHAYSENGSYTVTLTVTDNDGGTGTTTAVKTVLNRLPVASFTESATTVYTGEVIRFNASASYDSDGSIVSYVWTFDDGTNATGVVVDHAYSDDGVYTVTLTVTDDDGGTATATATKTVLNRAPIASFTESATTVYTGEVIYFNASASYDLDGSIVSYFWDFGDGSNTTGVVVSHAYADNGTYVVTLIVTDDDGATGSSGSTKTVLNRPPVAVFSESAEAVYTGEPITFNASESYDPDGVIISYFWDFGDGTNATGVIVEHAYSNNGVYTVTLTVIDNDGATATASAVKTVGNRLPVASFTESASTAFTNEIIYFNASTSYDSDGFIVSYFWAFGDDTNATGVTASHAYVDDGVYTVTLTVTDDDGAKATATSTKTILNRPPVASFTESASTVLTGEIIYFNASGSYDPDGSIVSYFWTFGDGTNTTGVAVSHSYADNSTYTVTLTVTDNDGASATATATKTVLNRPPVASFTESAETVYTGETISFNASNSYDLDGTIVSYMWDFGDGNTTTLATPTITHSYAENGTYTVTLTVTDNDGTTASASSTKTVLNRVPVASFSYSPSIPYTGQSVTFNATASYDSDGSIVSYMWDFGDGNITTVANAIITHTYVDNGTFTVSLTVTDNDGAANLTSKGITVLNRPPIASFSESATTVYTDEIIHFNASSSYDPDGTIVSYFWNFGDSSNATGVTVDHAYADDGVYTVTLTITDNDGATGTATATKTVLNRVPIASFTENATTVLTGVSIRFNASGSYDPDGSIVSYFWAFGDGTNASGVVVDHAYLDDGIYTVTLTITDDDGATATANATKTVLNRPPIASFTESAETVYTGEIITFDASSSYDQDGSIAGYFWTFGDGANATGMIVTHAYADNGTYTVTLTVTDDDGATASTTATKTVLNRPPIANFTESATTVLTGEVIYFNASSSYDPDGSIVSYFWDFGDGTNATGTVTQHAYMDDGVYFVTLTVTDNDGASATATATKYVENRPPSASYNYSPSFPIVGETVTFNASDSYDSDGYIISYQWNFGDGNVTAVTMPTVTHVYNMFGNYTVTLTLTDNDGYTSTTAQVVRIREYPTASFTYSPSFPIVGETVTFNASSSSPNGGSIITYSWNFGDGTLPVNTSNPLTTHVYSSVGNYTVTLTVIDSEGLADTAVDIVRVRGYPNAAYSFTPSYPIEGETVTFDAYASTPNGGSITSYYWNFGDGNTANLTTGAVTHVYSAIGNYTVTLTVTDSEGLSDSESKIVRIRGYPIAIFTYAPVAPYVGDTVTFNASLSTPNGGVIVSYLWNFGDGSPLLNTSNTVTQHIYSVAGNYTVTLTVTDSEGLSDTDLHFIVVSKAPVATFIFSPEFPKVGETVTFNASGSYDPNGYVVSFRWDFGDGNVTTVTSPTLTHAYKSTGVYTVTLTVTDNDGYTDTATGIVTLGTPKASFTYTPTYPIVNDPVTFNASASYDPNGYIVSYVWSFGDSNVTTTTKPVITHVYKSTGNFTVALTVSDNQGLTDTKTLLITIKQAPTASFTYTPTTPYVGDTVTFDASSATPSGGNVTNYVWNFGDGSPTVNQTTPIITHVYVAAGNYTVSLTIKDSAGLTNTVTKAVSIKQSPVALFLHSPDYPQAFDTVTFNASESYDANGYIVSYVWNFGDGNITTVTSPTVTHVYNSAGNYTVILIVSDNEGYTDTETQSLYVSRRPPVASFTSTPSFPIVSETVTFNASNSYDLDGTIANYKWNFGDGNITTVATQLITHQFSAYGNYTVTLTVTDNDGLINSKTTIVRVRDYPTAVFTYSPSIPGVGSTVTFNASSTVPNGGVITSYVWNFGDSSSQVNTTNPVVTHVFNVSGNYTITLEVADSENLTNIKTATIYVAEYPVASFTYAPTSPFVGDTVTFNASTSYDPDGLIVNFLWDFGDGSPTFDTSNLTATHTYIAGGNYTVTLTVTDSQGLSKTATTLLSVSKAPVAVFTYSPSFPIAGETVSFDASDSYDVRRPIANYTWNFGDGNVTTVTSPILTHVFTIEGSYTVSLTVTDTEGYTDNTTQIVNVRNYPLASFTYSPSYPIKSQDTTFNASASMPRGGVIVSYLWNFGDGTSPVNTTNPITTHVYAAVGVYNVTLTVTDSEGLTSTTSKTLKVRDYPTADFSWSPSSPTATYPITFNASVSKANSGVITGYTWYFGDGNVTTVTTPIITHTYSTANSYSVTLLVTNSEGLSSTVTKTVTVLNAPPIASFDYSPSFSIVNQTTTFNASASYDPDGVLTSYRWDFGDGNVTTVTTSAIYHTYKTSGNFTVTLTVTDNVAQTTSAIKTVRVGQLPVATFTYLPDPTYVGDNVAFNASQSYDPNGYVVSYSWNFGDGSPVQVETAPTVNHAYTKSGNYTAALTITDNEGFTASVTHTVSVAKAPVAIFEYAPSFPIAGDIITFNASKSYDVRRPIVNYLWNFGGGVYANTTTPTVTYSYLIEGNYTVTLTVKDSGGYTDTTSLLVRVRNYPKAAFTISPDPPIRGQTATFDASSSLPRGGVIISYSWNFGDGSPLVNTTNAVTTYTYSTFGNYTVTLIVADSEGLAGSISKLMTVREYPTASFTYSPFPPQRNVPTTFDASASVPNGGTIVSYRWNFGDGNITTVTSPKITHVYKTTGIFTVTLTVTDSESLNNSVSKSLWVVKAYPVASWTYAPSKPIIGQTVTFNASASYDPDGWIASYRWDFGDGNITTVTTSIIYHKYTAIGSYNVTLTVTDNDGYTSAASSTIRVCAYPTASFTWTPYPYAQEFKPVYFNASASTPGSGIIVSYQWNFGDGNITVVSDPYITHVFNTFGSYQVTLTVVNSDELSKSKTQQLNVFGVPVANFTWTPSTGIVDQTIIFDASSSQPKGDYIVWCIWNFGDGTPIVSRRYNSTATHSYATYGQFTVTLNVTNNGGLSNTTSKILTVISPPHAEFTWTPQSPYAYDDVTFDASASNPNGATIVGYTWNFGDGNVTETAYSWVTHRYLIGGNYTVTLNVTSSNGLSHVISKTISVAPATSPLASFNFYPSLPGVYEQIAFNASSSVPRGGEIVSFLWDFGDGNMTVVNSPLIMHTYFVAGNYSVTLNVTNTAGLWSTTSKQLQVMPISGPKADFAWFPILPYFNQTVTFDASSSTPGWNGTLHPPIVSYVWNFGDGNITTLTNPIVTHIYGQQGNFTVTLTVIDLNGLSGNLTQTIMVTGLVGDLNGDGKVDIKDIAIVAKAYGSYPGYPNWNPIADLNGDGKVDIKDVAIVAKQFGKTLSSMSLFIQPPHTPPYFIQLHWTLTVMCLLAIIYGITQEIMSKRRRTFFYSLRRPTCHFYMF